MVMKRFVLNVNFLKKLFWSSCLENGMGSAMK